MNRRMRRWTYRTYGVAAGAAIMGCPRQPWAESGLRQRQVRPRLPALCARHRGQICQQAPDIGWSAGTAECSPSAVPSSTARCPALGSWVNNIVGIVSTSDGKGYWLIGSDGGIFAFGDAADLGGESGSG